SGVGTGKPVERPDVRAGLWPQRAPGGCVPRRPEGGRALRPAVGGGGHPGRLPRRPPGPGFPAATHEMAHFGGRFWTCRLLLPATMTGFPVNSATASCRTRISEATG